MADFDPFNDQTTDQTQQEEDPAAAFLAREQDQFAELEDESFGITPSSQEQTQEDYAAIPTAGGDTFGVEATQITPDYGNLDMFDPTATTTTTTTDFDPYSQVAEEVPSSNDVYSSITMIDKERAEPEKIRLWREAQKERLTKKDEESEKKQEEWRAVAAKELEDWYKHQAEQLEKTKKNNREAEASFVQERDESVPGHEFERICRLCEFNPKGASKAQKDVSRMRSILLQLKQTPLVR